MLRAFEYDLNIIRYFWPQACFCTSKNSSEKKVESPFDTQFGDSIHAWRQKNRWIHKLTTIVAGPLTVHHNAIFNSQLKTQVLMYPETSHRAVFEKGQNHSSYKMWAIPKMMAGWIWRFVRWFLKYLLKNMLLFLLYFNLLFNFMSAPLS